MWLLTVSKYTLMKLQIIWKAMAMNMTVMSGVEKVTDFDPAATRFPIC